MNIWLLSYSVIKGNPNGGVDELMVILDNQWWQLMIPTICDVFYAAANWPDDKTVGVNDEQVGDVCVRLQRCVQHHCSDPGDGHLWLSYILMMITLYPGHHHKLPCSLRSRWRGIVARTQGLSRSQRWSLPRLKGLDIHRHNCTFDHHRCTFDNHNCNFDHIFKTIWSHSLIPAPSTLSLYSLSTLFPGGTCVKWKINKKSIKNQ